ncbi:substrate-binding domain-containing protein [Aureliella helgolandensis]|uniref:D-allose transporter subunit n=1 Tax=Aureliella helgolandensis TaxID=2527968 RepID=A0A518GCE1_9BACT|nr:substrate-binding domain-containing protein [Aureliella helgolandensis]QDV26217.1 D-allose transporter subunit [Aureliella helgolandensis]
MRPFQSIATLTAVALLFATVGCEPSGSSKSAATGGSGTKRIVLLNNTDSPFWDAARAGIAQAAEDLNLAEAGYSAGMDSNENAEQGQIEKLRQYGTQGDIAAVIISPVSATNPAIADELKNLHEKGIIIGCFDSDLDERFKSIREFYVGTDNISGGRVLGTAAKNLKPQGGSYVQFVGFDSQQNAVQRMDGFSMATEGWFTQKERKLDETDRGRARDNVRDVIDRYPELNVLAGIWSYNAPAIVDVVKEKGLRDRFAVVTFDAEQLAIQQMGEGMIDVMVVQNPFGMGYEAVRYAFAKLTGDETTVQEMFPNMGQPGGDVLDTGLKVVVPTSGSPLTAEMFDEFGSGVEFLSIGEFQEWLKEYNLTSS